MANREPWLEDPLGYLIGAERVDDFFARVFEREALVVAHNKPKRFEGLASIARVDDIVTGADLREGQLDLADASRTISRDTYLDAAGYVDRGAVAELHHEGATIILNQAHQLDPSLGRYCRALEHIFSTHVQTNLYLTPPNAQGFRTHYDNHDVLVIQIEGEKAWRLYDKPVDTPYRGEGFEVGKYETGELREEFVLKAGDCAYVPRGLMHDAMTSGTAASLHVTVGLIARTWADLMLEAVSEVALKSPELRRSLPAGYARQGFDRGPWRAHLQELGKIVARDIQLDGAMDLMADNFIRSRAAGNQTAIVNATRPIGEKDRFQRHAHAPYRIADDAEAFVVICAGGELKFVPTARGAVERAMNGEVFTTADLTAAGALDAPSLISRLFAYGLVARI
jgi:hypothetical protein